jgi:DNA-binding MarR family transcriptional regulator
MPRSGGKTDINALLQKAGIAEATVEAVVGIDAALQTWRRRAMKRELGQRALLDLKIGIDMAQFDVLVAIDAPVGEFGAGDGSETMVSTVAERLNIDPSRASRVVSEMVEAGLTRRAASQADARRTIIELTEAGQAIVDAVRAYKFLIMGDCRLPAATAPVRTVVGTYRGGSGEICRRHRGAGGGNRAGAGAGYLSGPTLREPLDRRAA